MTEQELVAENEHLRIENAKLKAHLATVTEQVRKIQDEISKTNCMAMALVNVMQGTRR